VDLETEIRAAREAGELHAAATRAIEGYGPEVLGFLVTMMRDETDASDVFAQASCDLWAGLARFEGRASFRTWFYALARHAAARFRRAPHRRRGRHVPASHASEIADRVRSGTLPYLRTEAKDGLAQIREGLEPDDRALLVLRVDRQMAWNDIARVLEPDADVARAAARIRKRFQLVKDDIRARALAAGLLRQG
jgi:RNA polymerase sigma-70 factor (ECF subfamily)